MTPKKFVNFELLQNENAIEDLRFRSLEARANWVEVLMDNQNELNQKFEHETNRIVITLEDIQKKMTGIEEMVKKLIQAKASKENDQKTISNSTTDISSASDSEALMQSNFEKAQEQLTSVLLPQQIHQLDIQSEKSEEDQESIEAQSEKHESIEAQNDKHELIEVQSEKQKLIEAQNEIQTAQPNQVQSEKHELIETQNEIQTAQPNQVQYQIGSQQTLGQSRLKHFLQQANAGR